MVRLVLTNGKLKRIRGKKMLKNYMKEGQKLPLFGVGTYIIYDIAMVNLIGIILFRSAV